MSRLSFAARLPLIVLALAPLSAGCVSRAAPFDALDKAQVTLYKIAPPAPSPIPGLAPGANPLGAILQQFGVPAEQVQQAQDALKPFLQGIPGLPQLPGMTPQQPMPPQQTALFHGQWQIAAPPQPVLDQGQREKLLDLFGSADSFTSNPGAQCWTPGMAVSFVDPSKPGPIDVLVSLDCNAANAADQSWAWPHQGKYALTPQSNQQLGQLYQQFFGPVPPQGA